MGPYPMSRNYRARVDGKILSIIWDRDITSEDLKAALIVKFCTKNIEVFK
jgi:hypothetical protein